MKIFLHCTAALSLGLAFAGCGGGSGIVTPTPTATTSPALYATPIKLPDIGAIYGLTNQNQILATNASSTRSIFLGSPTATAQLIELDNERYARAVDVNNSGVIIGNSSITTDANPSSVFWATPSATPQPLTNTSGIVNVNDINDNGAIVGWGPQNGQQAAFYWSQPSTVSNVLATNNEPSPAALAINSNGVIVGTSGPGTNPLLWTSPTATAQRMARLSQQTAIIGAMGINSNGNVFVTDSNSVSAFYASPTATPTRLAFLSGAPNSWGGTIIGAASMNASGVVVGTSPDSSGSLRAVRWRNGVVQDLNSLIPANSGWVLQRARSINDGGAIVGTGTYNGDEASFYMALR